MAVVLEDPGLTPEMKALQLRYQQSLGETMIKELQRYEGGAALAMINALGHHLVLSIRSLNKAGHLKPEAIDRILERLKILANEVDIDTRPRPDSPFAQRPAYFDEDTYRQWLGLLSQSGHEEDGTET